MPRSARSRRHPTRRSGATRACGRFDHSLAERFHMTLTDEEHVGVLEQAGLVSTEKAWARADLQARAARLEEEAAWIERYRQLWAARFDELDIVVEELKRQENANGRKEKSEAIPTKNRTGWAEVRARTRRHTHRQRACAPRVRGVDQGGTIQEWWVPKSYGPDPACLRNGCSRWRTVSFGVSPRRFDDEFFGTYLEVTPHSRLVWTTRR